MRVLLVCPEFPDTSWSFKRALKFIRKKITSPPLGLMTVAAMLPADWDLRLVDLNVKSLTVEDFAWADIAFISSMIAQRSAARAVIERCKQAGLTVVAGGPLFVGEHEHFAAADHFVLNEAEITLPPFLADLAAGHPQRVYATSEFSDIHQTPVPLWQLADLREYDTVNIQFSRGCPFNCDFCNITTLFGRRPRTKSASQIIAELDSLYSAGWRSNVFFVDDNFIGNKKILKTEVLPALIAWRKGKAKMPFSTGLSVNLADDPELIRLLVEAGITTVFVGLETLSDAWLSECSKIQNRGRDLVDSVKRLRRAGLQVQGGSLPALTATRPPSFSNRSTSSR